MSRSIEASKDSKPCNRKSNVCKAQRGFTILEMLVVLSISLILAGMAVFSLSGSLPSEQSTAGLNAAASVFRQGRDAAIAQRRNYELVVPASSPGTEIGLERLEIPAGFTALPVVTLPAPAKFMLISGIPDTPDGFGTCSSGLCFAGSPTQTWLSDGTFVNATGQPLNATIFVAVPNVPSSQRAFTVLGTTGRIRSYRWTGGTWALQ